MYIIPIYRKFAIAKAGEIVREVTRAHGGFVFCKRDNGYMARPMIMPLEDWRKWAKNAEVLDVAE